MAYTTVGSIAAEGGDNEFISVGTRGSVGSLVSMELDSFSRINEQQQHRKSAKSCGRIRSETVSVFCDKGMSLSNLVSRKDSFDAKKGSIYLGSPRTPRSSEGKKSSNYLFLASEVESPDSCRRKREPGYGLHKCRSQGRDRYLGKKTVHARKSLSDLDDETGGFVWINTPSRSVKKNRHQDPLMSSGHGKERGDDDDDIETGWRVKSGMSLVEVVDLKCRGITNHNNNNKMVNGKNWGMMSAIANRVMRGLSFSRLNPDDPHADVLFGSDMI